MPAGYGTAPDVELDEQAMVLRRRYDEAVAAGLTVVEARMFSESDVDIGDLRACVAGKCPLETLRQIVL